MTLAGKFAELLDRLPPRRARFVREFVIHRRATTAAKRAGYSSTTAHSIGSELRRVPSVRAAIESGIALEEASFRLLDAWMREQHAAKHAARRSQYPGRMSPSMRRIYANIEEDKARAAERAARLSRKSAPPPSTPLP